MKYISIDLEATGLDDDCLIIEFAAIPFDSADYKLDESLSFHTYVKCPTFEELKPKLSPWVIEHNEELIRKANERGPSLEQFKLDFERYLTSESIRSYREEERYVLFGKSLSAIDLPFLNRDLGSDFMKKHFYHRQLDLSSFAYALIDMNLLSKEMVGGEELMAFLGMDKVAHTALEDAINTAKMYFELLKKFTPS
ncbi:MAG: exonuclease domain-containing protein [Bacteriovoracales bacterium]|nr:exonuclease domain-containing protein [Bacteriovoracales bacterium]